MPPILHRKISKHGFSFDLNQHTVCEHGMFVSAHNYKIRHKNFAYGWQPALPDFIERKPWNSQLAMAKHPRQTHRTMQAAPWKSTLEWINIQLRDDGHCTLRLPSCKAAEACPKPRLPACWEGIKNGRPSIRIDAVRTLYNPKIHTSI